MRSNLNYREIIAKYPLNASWKAYAHANEKVNAIKCLRNSEGLGLKEAKDVVEVYLEKYESRSLPESVPSPVITLAIGGGVTLTVTANPDGTSKVERSMLIGNRVSQAELLRLVAYETTKVYTG